MRPGGIAVSIATPIQPPTDATVITTHLVARNDAAQLAEIVALVNAGELAVDVAESNPLRALASIHQRSEAGDTRGKITLLAGPREPDIEGEDL